MITGKVNAEPYDFRIETMKTGDEGFVHADNIVVTRTAIFLDLLSQVIIQNNNDEDSLLIGDFIPIKKIGEGFTENDFELNFSESDEFNFIIDGVGIYNDLIKQKELYIIFTKFELGRNTPEPEKEETLEELRDQLAEALEKEDYPLSIILRDKIATKETDKTTGSDSKP